MSYELKGKYFKNAVAVPDAGSADMIKYVPTGNFPNHPDGAHEITEETIKQMQANLEGDILVDIGHESMFNPGAVAAGWIPKDGFEARADGLYGPKPTFTQKTQEMVNNREYRFFSPVYAIDYTDKAGNKIGAVLNSVALTNQPYFTTEIDSIGNSRIKNNKINEEKMDKELLSFLNLPENATEEEVKLKLTDLKEKLGMDPDATIDDVVAKLTAPPAEEKKEEDPAPAAEVQALNARIKKLEEEKGNEKIESLITNAIAEGKILPAQKAIYLNSARVDFDGTKKAIDAMQKNAALPKKVNTQDTTDEKKNSSVAKAADFFRSQGRK